MPKVVVTGAAGQLGRATELAWTQAGAQVIALTRRDVDLADADATRRALLSERPDIIINCAAWNQVDLAEDRFADALAVNAAAVRVMAEVAAQSGATLVHYGTDFVFDGSAYAPYIEEEPPNPLSAYGRSKLQGESMALMAPRAYVLRVESLFGGPQARSSVDAIAAALTAGRHAPVFVDRTVSPSFVDDVVAATRHLLSAKAAYGLYHCVNTGHATWLELGRYVASAVGASADLLRPVSCDAVQLRAARPRYAALSNAKLARAGFVMPTWQDAVGRYLASTHRAPRATA